MTARERFKKEGIEIGIPSPWFVIGSYLFGAFIPVNKLLRPLPLLVIGALSLFALWKLDVFLNLSSCLIDHTTLSCTSLKNTKEIIFLLFGIFPTFLLWVWRNQDKKEEIENNQANFHKLVEWLGGKDETLQLAAVPQFLSFLKGEKGNEFEEPAKEALMARLQAWADSKECKNAMDSYTPLALSDDKVQESGPPEIPLLIKRIHQLIRENGEVFQKLDLSGIQLPFANLSYANLNNFNLSEANLFKAQLKGVKLNSAFL
ncbi:MAG: pentapeptide repeat-containing protein [SAR324 cluster bacterium]|nr:pentapeptide repeat-containing protein [SAR324 cluster bacterium]